MNVFVAADQSELFFTRKIAIDTIFERGHLPINLDTAMRVDQIHSHEQLAAEMSRMFIGKADVFLLLFHTSLGPAVQLETARIELQLALLRRFLQQATNPDSEKHIIVCVKALENASVTVHPALHESLATKLSEVGEAAPDFFASIKNIHDAVFDLIASEQIEGTANLRPFLYKRGEYQHEPLSSCLFYRDWKELREYVKLALTAIENQTGPRMLTEGNRRNRYGFSYAAQNEPGHVVKVCELLAAIGGNIEYVSMAGGDRFYSLYMSFSVPDSGDDLGTSEGRSRFIGELEQALGGGVPWESITPPEGRSHDHNSFVYHPPVILEGDSPRTNRPFVYELKVRAINAPGQLLALARLVADLGYNIESVSVAPTESGHPRQTRMALTLSPNEYEGLYSAPPEEPEELFLQDIAEADAGSESGLAYIRDHIEQRKLTVRKHNDALWRRTIKLAELETSLATLPGVRAFTTSMHYAWEIGGSSNTDLESAGGPLPSTPPVDWDRFGPDIDGP